MNDRPESAITVETFLPLELKGAASVQLRIDALMHTLQELGHEVGIRGKITILLCPETSESSRSGNPTRAMYGSSSPGDWYKNEDQMSHGGKGSGRIWTTD